MLFLLLTGWLGLQIFPKKLFSFGRDWPRL